jgi:hypothetical protein
MRVFTTLILEDVLLKIFGELQQLGQHLDLYSKEWIGD